MGLTVREATLDFLRRRDLTTIYSNPGSTEVPFLTALPDDFRFVLGLHEGAVVSAASGYALGRRKPSFVLLHTTAGLGNAVSALATARVNRTPLVVVIGQQDRRHVAYEPFLTGRLRGLAGDYPVWVDEPARPENVLGSLERAYHESETHHGPAVVIVPMGDWSEDAGDGIPAPDRVLRPPTSADGAVEELAAALDRARRPALVAGARLDTPERWAALVALAETLGCPVYQEAFSGQAGFPQDHPQWVGLLPFLRSRLRETLEPYDLVVAVGAPAFRQAAFEEGPLVPEGVQVAVVTDDADEVHRSIGTLAVLASPETVCLALASAVARRPRRPARSRPLPATPPPGPLKAAHVLQALGERAPDDLVLVEECPSNQVELTLRIPARRPLGFVSAAMGGLGWGLSAAVGLRMALPGRPVVAVLGDGSTLFGVHGLWTAATYEVGVLFVVLKNGGYRIMDQLAAKAGGRGPWPGLTEVDLSGIARALGCEAQRLTNGHELEAAFDGALPSLRERSAPLLLEIEVEPD